MESKEEIEKEFRKIAMSSEGCISIEDAIKEVEKKWPRTKKSS